MLLYNLRIALLSLKRNWILSSVIVGGIALGIAVSTMFSTTRHVFARNPIPHKSDVLYYVRLDSWDPQRPYPGDDPTRPPTQITYRDMVEIMKSDIPLRQSGMFKSSLYVFPDPKVGRPQKALVRLVFADFFPMFDLPFKYGSGWDGKADAGPEPVVVLSQEENDLLFGGANSVGKTVRIEDREFRVVGVLDTWRPAVKFYDLTQAAVQAPEPIYMPLNFLRPMKLRTAGTRALRSRALKAAWWARAAGSRCGWSCPARRSARPTRTSSRRTCSSRREPAVSPGRSTTA